MSWYRNKRVLVTGGAGFIGSHIVRALVQEQAHVVVLDNLSSGKLSLIDDIFSSIHFIEGDIQNKNVCLEATQKCDVIFHCAAFISVPLSFQYSTLCYETNVTGTQNLLDSAVKNNVQHFVFSSSAAIYGNQQEPCTEETQPRDSSPYAHSKIEAEKLCIRYSKSLSTVILRYFNVYDLDPDHQNRNSVISIFSQKIKQDQPLEMYGDGLQTRDFIHVKDVVHANLLTGTFPFKGDIFNIASGHDITLFDLIKELTLLLKPPHVTLLFKPAREGDIQNSQADCSKYQQFTSSISTFPLHFNLTCRGGEIGRHARFRF